ncbi:hypothetical protein JL101_032510 (plasmid) [Skermanella rosea]|uniref:hypothetical protein n=1 Tax=Skermanella rosea TaxID=1817965 RepID=UPI001933B762|nr:hypothetical protein [Skermanella rosea]UEM07637.1 hypothetical protein JL101_032510 [Skermanella rosea]
MRHLATAALVLAGLTVTACWDDEKEKKSSEFMSNLTKCENCKIDKPFLGSTEKIDEP